MVNEVAELRVRIEDPLPFTVSDTVGLEKGALLQLTEPRTASGAVILADAVMAGIAAREKVSGDSRTELAVFRRGWFDILCSGAATVGSVAVAGGDNYVKAMAQDGGKVLSGAQIIGTFLETATDGERVLVDVNIGG